MPAIVADEPRRLQRQLSQAGRRLFSSSLVERQAYPSGALSFDTLLRKCEASNVKLQITPHMPPLSTAALEELMGNRLELVIVGNAFRLRFEVGAPSRVEVTMLVHGRVQFTWVTDEDGHTEQWSSWLARMNTSSGVDGPTVGQLQGMQAILSVFRLLDLSEIALVASRAEPLACEHGATPPPRVAPTLNADWSINSAASLASDVSYEAAAGGGGAAAGGVVTLEYREDEMGGRGGGARAYEFAVREADGKLLSLTQTLPDVSIQLVFIGFPSNGATRSSVGRHSLSFGQAAEPVAAEEDEEELHQRTSRVETTRGGDDEEHEYEGEGLTPVGPDVELVPPTNIASDIKDLMDHASEILRSSHGRSARRRLLEVFQEAIDTDRDGLVVEKDITEALVRAGQMGKDEATRISSQMASEIGAQSANPSEEMDFMEFATFWVGISSGEGSEGASPASRARRLDQIVSGLEALFLGEPEDREGGFGGFGSGSGMLSRSGSMTSDGGGGYSTRSSYDPGLEEEDEEEEEGW